MCSGSMTIVKLMVQELTIMSYQATQESSKENWLLYVWTNTDIVVSESVDKTCIEV